MISLEDRQALARDIAVENSTGARLKSACEIVGIDQRSIRRWKAINSNGLINWDRLPNADRSVPSHALSETNEPRFVVVSPAGIVPMFADEGTYLASESTFSRVLKVQVDSPFPSRHHTADLGCSNFRLVLVADQKQCPQDPGSTQFPLSPHTCPSNRRCRSDAWGTDFWTLLPAVLTIQVWLAVCVLVAVSLADDIFTLLVWQRMLVHVIIAAWLSAALLFPAHGWMLVIGVAFAIAFLLFNFHPARVFMGDSGSIPLGFLAAVIGVIGWKDGLWQF